MRRVGRVLAAGVLAASVGLAQAQQSGEVDGLFVSPLPTPKGDPNAPVRDVDLPDPTAPDEDVATTQPASDDGTVAQVPDPGETAAVSGDNDDTTPGDASQVRVVFGGSSVNQNRLLRPKTEDADGEDTEAGDPAEPRWKRERSRRFRRAPDRSASTSGVQIAAPIVPIAAPDTVLQAGARLRQLDKMTGQTETFDIAVGEVRRIARLQIRLDACRAPEDNDTHGTMAFMQIWDTKRPEAPPAFSGWMFAESPALSALDHPRYDLWVINCTTSGAVNSVPTE